MSGSPPGDILAYVHWYTSMRVEPHSRLQRVQKLMRGTDCRSGGIVKLSSIRFPCSLATALDTGIYPAGINNHNAYKVANSFYINPFASHVDYELFW